MKHEHQVKVPEEIKTRIARVKQHLLDNKTSYLIGAGCLVTGYLIRKPQIITVISEAPSIAPVFNNLPVFNNDNSSTVNFGGYATKIVQRMSDSKIWGKAGDAAYEIAEEHNIPYEYARQLLSKHTNGHLPDVFGEVYRTIGQGTTG